MVLVDSHCHLDFPHFDDDRDQVVSRMHSAGVRGIVAVAVELEQNARLQRLCAQYENVWFSTGVHPNHEVQHEPTVAQLVRQATHPRCVAVGETGLDYFRHRVPAEVQQVRLRTHLAAAAATGKPVIIHMREADDDVLRVLREEGVPAGGVMHCFSSTRETAAAALDLGMHISFSGNVTFKRNEALREVAAYVPLDRLLVETDAPYLAPVPHRGKRNEPTMVRHVAQCVAEARGMAVEALAEATTRNACALFQLDLEV
ncbi:MAG: TatD family deoxyribonuclease [Zetaproteobacteria bacterium]|nr:MAG: TatD family deoxyribonuclease [Zetaproteobacteria bacterium]